MGKDTTNGLALGIAAYVMWGLLPMYWKSLGSVSAIDVLSHRVFWTFVVATVVILATRQWPTIRQTIQDSRQMLLLALASATITLNWGLYIWAAQTGHIIEGSLGYYINPLVTVLFGVVFFQERLNRRQLLAIGVAAIGVLILVVRMGVVPWISLALALTFSTYWVLKKKMRVQPIISMSLETALASPFALGFILFRQAGGQGAFGRVPPAIALLLIGTGLVTLVPLLMSTESARRIPLSTLGFVQYIMPTGMFLLGVFVYHEPFQLVNAISFGFIWLAVLIYSLAQTERVRA